jgi:hypothetical protein
MKNNRTIYRICTAAVFAVVVAGGLLLAQSLAPLEGPPLGAVLDAASGSLLTLQGVPGSAIVGSPIPGSPLSTAAISSEQGYALGVMRDSGKVVVVRFGAGSESQLTLQAAAYPDRIILSPAGTSAVLWYANQRSAKIVTGLPGSPLVNAVNLVSVDRDPDVFAISDDGSTLLAAASSAANGFYRFQKDAQEFVSYSGQIAALAFLRKSSDALLADLTNQRLTWVRDARAGEAHFVTASPNVAIGAGESIGISRDNTRALLASPQSQSLSVVDLAAKVTSARVDCGCSIAGLTPLNGSFLFRLNEPSGSPLAIVDASVAKPSLSVVPYRRRESN